MRRLLMVIGALVCASPVCATEAWEFEIAVPVGNVNASAIQVLHVVRSINVGSARPGTEIRHTCDPAYIQWQDGHVLADRDGPVDRNEASRHRFRVGVEGRDVPGWRFVAGAGPFGSADIGGRRGHYVVDSLRVRLDLTPLITDTTLARMEKNDGPGVFDPVVEATVAAILDNATRSDPPLTSIRLEIEGPSRYARHAKLYRITPRPPRAFDNMLPRYRKPN